MNNQLQKHLEECKKKYGKVPSIDIINEWIREFMQERESLELPEFEGYSHKDMDAIMYGLWDEGCPVKMQRLSIGSLNMVPLFRQVRYVIDVLLRDGKIKLTATKAIPPKVVRELYELGARDRFADYRERLKVLKESDSVSVSLVHVMLKVMKVIKEQKGVMTLTKAGMDLAKDNNKLFEELLRGYTCRFNFAYLDGIENEEVGRVANGFSLILVAKYGNERRSYRFYADKYFTAFPDLLDGFDRFYGTAEEHGAHCYSLRTFELFMLHFGLIEIERTQFPDLDTYIKKTPLFDELVRVVY